MKKLCLLLLLFCFATSAHATTRYVDTGCSNNIAVYVPATRACTGGSARSYNSIDNALAANTTVAGDILYIRAGTYEYGIDSSTRTIPSGSNWGNAPIIAAYTAETVTIRYMELTSASVAYVIFDRLIVDSQNSAAHYPFHTDGAHHVRFQNGEIKNSLHHGLGMFGTGGSHEILNNLIHNNGTVGGLDHGIYNKEDNVLMEGNSIYSNYCSGIQTYPAANNDIMRKNKIYNNATGGDSTPNGDCFGIVSHGTGHLIYNNVFYNSTQHGTGIYLRDGTQRAYNNTIYNFSTAIFIGSGSNNSGTYVRNNLLYGNGTAISGSATTSNNPTANPNFVNSGTGDFHLTAGSSAINAGCNCGTEITTYFTTDYDANARGSQPWDVGAFEYQAGGGDSMSIGVPDGGQSWTIGSVQTITWTCIGCGAGGIDIDLDRDNNGTFEEVIANDTANDGTFDWTVTGAASTTCKVRIRDSDASPTDTSAAVFSIVASGGSALGKIFSDNTIGTKIGEVPGTTDTWIWQLDPTVNNGSSANLYVNKYDASGHRHSLLKFDGLSQIPASATITSVTLGLYLQDGVDATAQTIDIRRSLRNWSESQATWNEFSTGNAWTTAGSLGDATDRVAAASAQIGSITITPGFFSVTVTDTASGSLLDDVKKFVNGTYSNYGWHLERNGTGNDGATRTYGSSKGTDGQRPFMQVDYTTVANSITVTQPKPGDLFLSGQTGPARWTSDGVSGNVRIDLSRDGGTTWETLVPSTPFSSADTTLTYSAPTSSNCRVRVVSLNDTNIVGTTSGAFRIGGTRAGFLLNP